MRHPALLPRLVSLLGSAVLCFASGCAWSPAPAPEGAPAFSAPPPTAPSVAEPAPAPAASPAATPSGVTAFGILATPEELAAGCARATSEAYPDADTVVILDAEHVRYDPDGANVSLGEVCVKALTEPGRRDIRTQSFWYTERYSRKPRLVVAEILRANGTREPLDTAALVHERIDRSGMGSNIYDPMDKIVELTIPDLQIGDALHYVIERETFKSRMENAWSDWVVLEGTDPILRAFYEVAAPAERPLRSIQLRDPVPGCGASLVTNFVDEASGATIHRWDFRDVPQAFPEPDMPSLYTCVQRLLLSTEADWRDLSRWYDRICQPRLDAVTDAMREKVAELTRDCADDDARIRAVFDFVSQEIRYMGITDEDVSPGYEPHDVSLTFENRYGVCRDKAALLAAMLRLAGIDAHPVLISVGYRKDPDVPQPFFNHAIAAVDRGAAAGKGAARYLLMDPTNEKSRDLFPSYLYNCDYLIATAEGETLLNAGPAPAEDNLVRVRTTGELAADRSLTLESCIDFTGIADVAYRNGFARMKPEERQRYFERILRARLPGAELLATTIVPDDPGNTALPLQATLRYRAYDVPVDGDGAWLVRLPWISPALGFSGRVLGSTGLETRRFPLEIEPTCGEDEQMEIRLAPGALGEPIALPARVDVVPGAVEFRHEVTCSENVLKASRATLLRTALVQPADYAALRADLQRQEAAARRHAVFAPPAAPQSAFVPAPPSTPPAPPAADAEILLDRHEFDLADEHNWTSTSTARTRILTYSAVKDRSELRIDYNPAWETVEIVRAAVTAPDGTVQEAGEKEINELDASWNASAPRYPGAKTLVISLPGVQVGSTVETVIRRTCRDRPWFSFSASPRGDDPVQRFEATVVYPAGMRVRSTAVGLQFERPDAGPGRAACLWTTSDIPAMQPENHLPPFWLRTPLLKISTRGDFVPFAADAQARFSAALAAGSDAARAKGAALAEGLATRAERVEAVRDFVATDIRPAGPNWLSLPPDAALSSPDATLRDGYGHRADRLLLTLALLQGAGIDDAELVPVYGGDVESPDLLAPALEYPSSTAFSDLLLRVPADGADDAADGADSSAPEAAGAPAPVAEWWLGDTDQYAKLGATPAADDACLRPDGSLGAVRAAYPARPFGRTEIAIAPDGSARIACIARYTGSAWGSFRKQYLEMRPEDRRRHHLELVGGIARGAVADGPLETDTDSYPGQRSYAATIPDYAVRDGRMLYLASGGINPLAITSALARENDFYIGPQSRESVIEIDYALPPETARVLIAPPTGTVEFPQLGTVECATEQTRGDDGRVHVLVRRTVRLHEGIAPADQYATLVLLSQRLQHPRFGTLLVELGPGPDAPADPPQAVP